MCWRVEAPRAVHQNQLYASWWFKIFFGCVFLFYGAHLHEVRHVIQAPLDEALHLLGHFRAALVSALAHDAVLLAEFSFPLCLARKLRAS